MKFINRKSLIITSTICLLPILLGLTLWYRLPDTIAIHFNINNTPDGFASKEFAVFGIPIMMAAFQIFCCIVNDINIKKHGNNEKIERVTKWILPIITIIIQAAILGYAIGLPLDIRKIAAVIVGVIFLVTGNYLPKLDYVKNYNLDTEKARKINSFVGFGTVIMGILALITVFLPPITTVIWLFMLIPFGVISVVYGIKASRK